MGNSNSNTALGVLAGLAVGTALGLLFAPDKGSKTRKKIAEETSKSLDAMKTKLNNISTAVSHKADDLAYSVSETAKDLGEKGKVKVQELERKGRDLLDKAAHSV